MSKVKRFGDLGLKFDDVESWYKLNDLVDEEITVLDFIKVNGQFSEYAIIKFVQENDGVIKATTTGAKVILEKLQIAKDQNLLPLVGQIVKEKRWYDIR